MAGGGQEERSQRSLLIWLLTWLLTWLLNALCKRREKNKRKGDLLAKHFASTRPLVVQRRRTKAAPLDWSVMD